MLLSLVPRRDICFGLDKYSEGEVNQESLPALHKPAIILIYVAWQHIETDVVTVIDYEDGSPSLRQTLVFTSMVKTYV